MGLFDGLGEGGMLEGLKSRLGFGGDDDDRDSRVDEYDDYDDEYDDFDEDDYSAPDAGYDDGFDAGYGRSDRYAPRYDSSRRGTDFPPLVSIEDVKNSTQVPDRLRRDPLAPSRPTQSYVGGRTVLDETVPPESSPAHNAALRDSRLRETSRSEGLDSLFEPTTPSAYDPYEAYSSKTPSSFAPPRSLSVLKPQSYAEVERIAKVVRSGDVVVLVLTNTPDQLAKRILDFSFGVSSALEANVECPAEKVFAIARGNALSADEKARLHSQGVL